MTTYVLNDTEVRLTGRTAQKKGIGNKTSELVEVTPSDENNGNWKKWVPKATLFEIAEQNPLTDATRVWPERPDSSTKVK